MSIFLEHFAIMVSSEGQRTAAETIREMGEDDPVTRPEEPSRKLQDLVGATRGLQPWRRLFHAANGLLIAGVLLFSPLSTRQVVRILGIILCFMLALDAVRLTSPGINERFFRIFRSLASPREERKPASSTWYVLGVLLTLLLFPGNPALAGITVLALADPAASIVGRTLGIHRLGKGTWEGSSAFLLVAFLCVLTVAPWPTALGTALVVALLEIVPWPLDDNLILPLATAAILSILL